jgi:BspA type Leucine rich repeat region (6 copies)
MVVRLIAPAQILGQDFNYTTNNGTVTITHYTGRAVSVAIPDTISGLPVTSIGTASFYGNPWVTEVTIPNSTTNIGDDAFSKCTSLTNILIGTSVTSIGYYAFYNCIRLNSVTIPNSVTSVEDFVFDACTGLTNVTIGSGLATIGGGMFLLCSGLARVTIPGTVTKIGPQAFSGCTRLANAVIPNSVTTIGLGAFYGCASLTNVTIGNSVTSIEASAFEGCTSLTNVTIPNNVTSIGVGAFMSPSLKAMNVDTNNPAYSSVDGVLFDKSQRTLVEYPAGQAGSYTISNTVTSIGVDAFDVSYGLTSVTIPDSVTSIGNGAFQYCLNLTNVTIPNSITSIGVGTFYNCYALPSITIPGSVTNIGDTAFSFCMALTNVYFEGAAPSFGVDTFDTLGGGYQPWYYWDPVTIYYLAGTAGWSTNLIVAITPNELGPSTATLPTELWLPRTQITDAGFGLRSNRFGFNIDWASGRTVVVEASTNLINAAWYPVGTNTLTTGPFYFRDPDWTNYPGRFYRIRSP